MSIRAHWTSRTAFVLAAIGSAIGLGNLIRFPYICSQYGGGAFLIAYIVALCTAGIPIMILEFGLGHMSEGSAPKAFRKIHPNLEWLGWIASGVGFFIVIYYSVIMAWAFSYLFDAPTITKWAGQSGEHFAETVGIAHADGPLKWGGFQWRLLIGLFLTWVAVVAAVWKGATTVSKVVYWTVLVPWFLLIVLVIRSMTLPGAFDGVKAYLTPDLAVLFQPGVWLAAYTQVFFSLSIGFGIMIAYASFLPKKTDLVKNAIIICIADSVTAFVAGLAVYGCLGYLAHVNNVTIAELPQKGFGLSGLGLTFVTYPHLLNQLPAAREFFAILFYLMILTLGVDSAFSLLESFASAVRDKWNMSHGKANMIVGVSGFVLALPLITGAGLYWVDIMDHFMTFFGLAIVAFIECFVVAYIFGCDRMRRHIDLYSDIQIHSAWDWMIQVVAPWALFFFLAMELRERIQAAYEGYDRWAEFLGGWLLIIVLPLLGLLFQAIPWVTPAEAETVVEDFDTK